MSETYTRGAASSDEPIVPFRFAVLGLLGFDDANQPGPNLAADRDRFVQQNEDVERIAIVANGRGDEAKVEWNAAKKQWQVVIQVGAEVIRRPCPNNPHDAGDADLRSVAVQAANDEGYDVEAERVSIVR